VPGQTVVIVLVILGVGALLAGRFALKAKSGESGEGRQASWYITRGAALVAGVAVLAAMSQGCESDEKDKAGVPGETTSIPRVTCTSYRAEDCPPAVPVPPQPPQTFTPATPNTAGIPDEIPA
jgi:hypothetical protein